MLTISCEQEEKKEEKEEKFTRKEYNFNSFSRSFSLPPSADRNHITANYENGLLKVLLPMQKEKQSNRSTNIPVQ